MDEYKIINTQQIESIAAGDSEFMIELTDIFLSQIPEFISKMKGALEDENWLLLAREAHTAKSSVLTFGMEETGTILKNIQVQAEANETDDLPEMVKKTIQNLDAAIPELHKLKDSLITEQP